MATPEVASAIQYGRTMGRKHRHNSVQGICDALPLPRPDWLTKAHLARFAIADRAQEREESPTLVNGEQAAVDPEMALGWERFRLGFYTSPIELVFHACTEILDVSCVHLNFSTQILQLASHDQIFSVPKTASGTVFKFGFGPIVDTLRF